MNGDMSVVTKTLLQFPLNIGGSVMCLVKSEVSIHAYVYLYSNAVADVTRAQVMGFKNSRNRFYNILYFLFCLLR